MATNIKITELSEIAYANILTTTVFPLIRMDIVQTQKGTLGNIGNAVLNGAGTTFSRAATANVAYTVANAAQPAITSVGTLTSLVVSGNISSAGGTFTTWAKTTPTTFSGLVAAATAGAGARSFITDANGTTFASVAAGGGANAVPVYSDGTQWLIG